MSLFPEYLPSKTLIPCYPTDIPEYLNFVVRQATRIEKNERNDGLGKI